MQVIHEIAPLRHAVAELRRQGAARIGLVPTMGALHAGHLSLVEAVRARADAVVVSIFVNPLQFGPNEDLSRYPRTEEADKAALRAAGVEIAWMPTVEAMYGAGNVTQISLEGPALGFEGTVRPGHFRGVATVCTKLFMQSGADVAAFGEKDWQQLQVVRRTVRDLDMPIEILPVPTAREEDGLAMSSRNRFLAPAERAQAARLPALLAELVAALRGGAPVEQALAAGEARLVAEGFAPDYLALVEPESLLPLATLPASGGRLLAAAKLGAVRLLDNWAV